jgi:type II secretion system protein N
MSRRVRLLLYSLFALFSFTAALLLTFPYETLRRRLESEASRRSPGTTLVINEIGPALPLGVRLADVLYAKAAKGSETATKYTFDRIRLTPSLLSLLTGRVGINFALDLLGGTIQGTAAFGASGGKVSAELDGLQLGEGKLVENATGMQMLGAATGRLEATTGADGQVTDGLVRLNIDGAKIKSGKIAGFTLPPLDLGTPALEIDIAKGEAKLTKLEAKSSDIELGGTATVNLKPDLMLSPIKGSLKLRPTEGFLSRNPALKGAMGLAGPMRKPDGSLEVPLNGTMGRPVSLPGMRF